MEAVTSPVEAPRVGARPGDILWEVLAVPRLAFTLRLDAARLVGHDATIALLGTIALLIWAVLGRLDIKGPATLDPPGVPEVAAFGALAVALGWLLSRVSRPRIPLRQALWLVAGYLPAVAVIGWALLQHISPTLLRIIVAVSAVHAALYFFFGLRALGARPVWLPFAPLLAVVAAMLTWNQRLDVDFLLWKPQLTPEQLADYRESEVRAEELMYLQADRIQAVLSGVGAGAAHSPDVYFVGFAGFGPQKVFAQEIDLAAQRVHERYGIDGRRVLLVNDRRDYDRHPLASPTALARTLQGIAARMDRDQDVLFLAISSHGKQDPYLVVENGALPVNKLEAETLRDMLRESGIRWKVLVISACYAGAFIEPLRDPYTAIITAAAPDRTSFGCNDRRALTYFGEAFYRDALPESANLREAFQIAKADIERRERKEGLKPSLPQAFFGAEIERKLEELEAARAVSQPLTARSAPGPEPSEGTAEQ